jgi:uncharacterized protein (TIGR02996 family)
LRLRHDVGTRRGAGHRDRCVRDEAPAPGLIVPRYEKAGEFWAITHEGKQLVIVTGAIGRPGKESVRTFVTAEHASAQLAKLTGEKQQDGWTYVERATTAATDDELGEDANAELEAAIVANPYDEVAYSVYSDWLQSRGAPRGQLIALQLAEENDPDNQRLRAATRAYLQANRRAFERGLDDHVAIQGPNGPACVWRFGFLHRIELDRAADDELDSAKLIADVLRHPSGRFVTEIWYREYGREPMKRAVAAIGKHAPPTLRALSLMTRHGMPSLAAVMTAPLRQLVVKGRSGDLGRDCMISLVRAPATLDSLELRFGPEDAYGEIAPLFRRGDLALRRLALRGCGFADEAIPAIATSAFARTLEDVDVALSPMRDLSRLADRTVFPALRRVALSRDRVTPQAIAVLGQADIKVTDVRRDPDDCGEDAGEYYDDVAE